MKNAIITLALILLTVLTGCSGTAGSASLSSADAAHSDSAMQMAYDTSLDARSFADGLLEAMLTKQGITDYTIDMTSGGFITNDPIIYTVGYQYTHNGQTEVYGYKLKQSKGSFTVIAEGTEIGEFMVGNDS